MASVGENTGGADQPPNGISGMLDELHKRTITLQQLSQELGDKLTDILYPESPVPEGMMSKKHDCPMMGTIQSTLDETNATIGFLRGALDRLAL